MSKGNATTANHLYEATRLQTIRCAGALSNLVGGIDEGDVYLRVRPVNSSTICVVVDDRELDERYTIYAPAATVGGEQR